MHKYSISMTMAERLRALMRWRGIRSQRQLARLSGVPQTSIHRILSRGETYVPALSTVSRLAKALGTTIPWLSEGDHVASSKPHITGHMPPHVSSHESPSITPPLSHQVSSHKGLQQAASQGSQPVFPHESPPSPRVSYHRSQHASSHRLPPVSSHELPRTSSYGSQRLPAHPASYLSSHGSHTRPPLLLHAINPSVHHAHSLDGDSDTIELCRLMAQLSEAERHHIVALVRLFAERNARPVSWRIGLGKRSTRRPISWQTRDRHRSSP